MAALREKYAEVFGEATRSGNRAWLLKRVAWRVQALAHGDLTERANARAAELARDADLRVIAPRKNVVRRKSAGESGLRPIEPRAVVIGCQA